MLIGRQLIFNWLNHNEMQRLTFMSGSPNAVSQHEDSYGGEWMKQ